ncbi:DUF551 domain-containing protein [Rodentibacter pneumotropicus]|uniref:DUF551 domain-containing protein n=1 Tax=Rodentibacter pneumotropicus TaxID=758 RepID=UPI00109CEF34|nr:DUF551 domain-containing protein [Rodentibacter pneumotropicus]THA09430.1 DUF551 domain-containing protein [Rodentibacter pneumotropicus]
MSENNHWISIKAQLPKLQERVLIFVPKTERNQSFEQHIAVRLNKYEFALQDNFLHLFDTRQISHWKPLPKPPNN